MSSRKIKNLSYFANAIHPGPEGARFCCVVRDKMVDAFVRENELDLKRALEECKCLVQI